jgi:hypothetical protein
MTILQLDKLFSIELDEIGNHTLVESREIKTGKTAGDDRKIIHGYYSNLTNALRKYTYLKTLDDASMINVDEYITRYEKAVETLINRFDKKKLAV